MIDFSRQMYISYQSIVGIRNDRSARAHIILMHGILHEGLSQWGERINKKCGHIAALGRALGERSLTQAGRQAGQLPVFSPLVVFGVAQSIDRSARFDTSVKDPIFDFCSKRCTETNTNLGLAVELHLAGG